MHIHLYARDNAGLSSSEMPPTYFEPGLLIGLERIVRLDWLGRKAQDLLRLPPLELHTFTTMPNFSHDFCDSHSGSHAYVTTLCQLS